MTEKTIKLEPRISEEQILESAKNSRLSIPKTYKLYVDGKFPRSESGRYYPLKNAEGTLIANICSSSRKDLRDAVTLALAAQAKWAKTSAMLKGQILYRMAEMLEGRASQFVEELMSLGSSPEAARAEVENSIDRLIYFAGWADKYQQVFSSVNPVASSHFNFSVCEPVGVIGVLAPEDSGLLGFISTIAPIIVGGNTVIVLASESKPLPALTMAEVFQSSDLPPAVVNLLSGSRKELLETFGSHMELAGLLVCNPTPDEATKLQKFSSLNLKRLKLDETTHWHEAQNENPYRILDFQEIKTTWHPIGN